MLDIDNVRSHFPILSREVYGKPLVYLDNAATTQKPKAVIDKITEVYTTLNSNVHRGVHFLSQAATDAHEASRVTVQKFINASSPNEIVFTRGATESINLVASSYCREFCKPGDEIMITAMEHHSNIVPWQIQAQIHGLKLQVAPINEDGELLIDEFEKRINNNTKLIALTHVSNVLGTINPINELTKIAHKHNVPVLIDAAQSVQHLSVDVQQIDCDFLVFSSHKVYGPTGVGVLYGKRDLLNAIPPYQGGGEMISTVTFDKTTYNDLPFKFEAGTPDFVGTTALATALDYVSNMGLANIKKYEDELLVYATQKMREMPPVKIYGNAKQKSSVISFLVDGIHPYDVGTLLDKMGIAVRTGHHCAEPLMSTMGIDGTIRISFAFYNTFQEIDIFIDALKRIISMFK